MHRRAFVAGTLGLLAAPLAVEPQPVNQTESEGLGISASIFQRGEAGASVGTSRSEIPRQLWTDPVSPLATLSKPSRG
jgi:hypothetical protein